MVPLPPLWQRLPAQIRSAPSARRCCRRRNAKTTSPQSWLRWRTAPGMISGPGLSWRRAPTCPGELLSPAPSLGIPAQVAHAGDSTPFLNLWGLSLSLAMGEKFYPHGASRPAAPTTAMIPAHIPLIWYSSRSRGPLTFSSCRSEHVSCGAHSRRALQAAACS